VHIDTADGVAGRALGRFEKGDRYAKGASAFPCGKIKSEKRDTRTDTSAEASRDGHKLHAARFNRARQTNQSLSLLSASPPACNGLIKLAAAAVSVGSLSAIITAVARSFNFPRSRIGRSSDRIRTLRESPTRERSRALARAGGRRPRKASGRRRAGSHAISSFASIENAFTLRFAPSLPLLLLSLSLRLARSPTRSRSSGCLEERERERARSVELIKKCNHRADSEARIISAVM